MKSLNTILHRVILPVLLLFPTLLQAQNDTIVARYGMRYVKEHLYYHQVDQMNVIDVELEWPEAIDGQRPVTLQALLAHELLGVADNSEFTPAYEAFRNHYGQPVTSLDTLPDPEKYCYTDILLRHMGGVEGRFDTYFLSRTVQPQRLSVQQADTTEALITYDIASQQVLQLNDIVSTQRWLHDLTREEGLGPFMQLVVDHSLVPIPEIVEAMNLESGCLLNQQLLVLGTYTVDGQKVKFTSLFSYDDMLNASDDGWTTAASYLTQRGRELIKAKPGKAKKRRGKTAENPTASIYQGTGRPIYTLCDEAPAFPGGAAAMKQFLTDHLQLPTDESLVNKGKCLAEFLVKADGTISDIVVIETISPLVDREIVRVLRSMPRWTPGRMAGQPVDVRMKIPVQFTTVD